MGKSSWTSEAERTEAEHKLLIRLLALIKELDGGRCLTPLLWKLDDDEMLALTQCITVVNADAEIEAGRD